MGTEAMPSPDSTGTTPLPLSDSVIPLNLPIATKLNHNNYLT
jgi:hypothetical protein